MKTIVIAGASGFVGSYLNAFFSEHGWKVLTIGRSKADGTWNDQPSLIRTLEGADALVNLAGKSVNCRFSDSNVRELIRSRVETTSALGDAIALCTRPPKIWVNAGGASIYREQVTIVNTESSPADGEGVMADVARRWEEALYSSSTPLTHKVVLRTTLVLGSEGGVYPIFRFLTRTWNGGSQGSGRQMMSWIHIHDLALLIATVVQSENPPHVVNAAAPQPLCNREFMRCFRKSLGVGFGIAAPAWLIKLGTLILGVDSELVLRGMNVKSAAADQMNFQFEFDKLDKALEDLAKSKGK
jgi:uncharacterized protein (TIGR01777 family)